MEEEIITLETAKLAKEKGFREETYFHYSQNMVNNLELLIDPLDPQVGTGEWKKANYNHDGWVFVKYAAPTQSQLQKWLREKHFIHINIFSANEMSPPPTEKLDDWHYYIQCGFTRTEGGYDTYEEALEAALQETLKAYFK